MSVATQGSVSLTSQWFIRPGFEKQVQGAVKKLAADIALKEPGTLTYLVHMPWADAGILQSLPPSTAPSLLFFETYRDADAFKAHIRGTLFKQFVNQYGHRFIPSDPFPNDPASKAEPYTTVQFLTRVAGFVHDQPREES
jgi:quinol monooxygenase YgiN